MAYSVGASVVKETPLPSNVSADANAGRQFARLTSEATKPTTLAASRKAAVDGAERALRSVVLIAYGSNAGTSEELAHMLADELRARGYQIDGSRQSTLRCVACRE